MRAAITFDRALSWLFFAAGLAIALRYADQNAAPGESGQAALALLNTGVIGDPYSVPTGPTAHVSPCLVWLLAAVYWLFGGNTPGARVALGVIAALLYAGSMAATLRLCAIGSAGRAGSWIARLLLITTPMFLFLSVVYFRQWDQPFAAYILISSWLIFEHARTDPRPYRSELWLAVLAGIGGLFSPSVLPTLGLALAGLIWMRRKLGDYRLTVLLCAAVLAAGLLPWGVRNELMLGKFILTRSNFGLELDAGNGPGALGYSGSGTEAALHPHDSIPAAMQLRTIGEVAYMQAMTERAGIWVAANPGKFLHLTVERIKLTFFPAPEMIGWVPGVGPTLLWMLFAWSGALKVAALLVAITLRRQPLLALGFSVLPLASFFVTHVNLRYELTTYFTTVALIGLTADSLLQTIKTRWSARQAIRAA